MTGHAELRPGAALASALRSWSTEFLRLHLTVLAFGAPLVVITTLLSTQTRWLAFWAADSFLGMSAYATEVAMNFAWLRGIAFLQESSALSQILTQQSTGVGLIAVLLQYAATGAVAARVCGAAISNEELLPLVFRFLALGLLTAFAFVAVDVVLFELLFSLDVDALYDLVIPLSWMLQLALSSFFWLSLAIVFVERAGVLEALKRSIVLSQGSRMRIAAILILIALVTQAVLWALHFLAIEGLNIYIATLFTLGLILPVLKGCILAAVYLQLREQKEGPPVEKVTAVFG